MRKGEHCDLGNGLDRRVYAPYSTVVAAAVLFPFVWNLIHSITYVPQSLNCRFHNILCFLSYKFTTPGISHSYVPPQGTRAHFPCTISCVCACITPTTTLQCAAEAF